MKRWLLGLYIVVLVLSCKSVSHSQLQSMPSTCKASGFEFHCEIKAGLMDIGDGEKTAVRIRNTSQETFRIVSISVPWFAGDNKSCFAEFGVAKNIAKQQTRDDKHTEFLDPNSQEGKQARKFYQSFPVLVGQKEFGEGELAFSAKAPGEGAIPPLNQLNLEVKPGDEILLLGANGCVKRDPNYTRNETPMTYRLQIDRNLTSLNRVLRLPRQDRVMRCQGVTMDIEDPRYGRTWTGPWQNNLGKGVRVKTIRTYAVSGAEKRIDSACIRACKDAQCNQILGSICGDKITRADQLVPLSMWVKPGEYLSLEASNNCPEGRVWNYVSYLGVEL